ncbi:hypothetical protein ONK29_26080, partial [Salmonella enterica subsp. enterica serovar Anatum]|nr:hypothetical protein [Salmonella enterica subsp. enterica serovar Anatum]
MSLPDSPLQLIGILFLLSILPLIIVMGTSFLKLAVVFSAASEEQSKGISQVGVAITQMDSVTQQNAALVEQVSAAAAALER